jgi:predicted TIM-barrel fold metal-dependent hydrolase
VRRSGGRFVGFAWVHPRRDARSVDALVAEAVRLGLRGIKVHGTEATPTRAVCEAAAYHRLPVLVDVAGKPWTAEMFATRFPQVDFVLAHLGSFADDWRAHRAVIDQLARLPNVYADTSGVRRFDYLVEAVRRAGPEKLLYGSDGPWLHPGLELEKVRLLGLDRRGQALVLGGNAARLLGRSSGIRRPLEEPHQSGPGLIYDAVL